MRTAIVEGMATILWASAWAAHAEEHRCTSLCGCEITEIMPEIPECAYVHARAIAAAIERENGMGLSSLYRLACDVHGSGAASATRFGECLAYEAMGDGVTWFDDHAPFDLEIPACADNATHDLQCLADELCDLAPVIRLANYRRAPWIARP